MKSLAALLGLLLLASCSASTGGGSPPVDAAPEGEDASSDAAPADAGDDASAQEAGAEADVRIERPNWWEDDSYPVPRYDGPADAGGSGNLFDARGPDGQCFIPPPWEGPWLDLDPDSGVVTCNYPLGTWQHIVCDCIIDTFYPDAGYDRDR